MMMLFSATLLLGCDSGQALTPAATAPAATAAPVPEPPAQPAPPADLHPDLSGEWEFVLNDVGFFVEGTTHRTRTGPDSYTVKTVGSVFGEGDPLPLYGIIATGDERFTDEQQCGEFKNLEVVIAEDVKEAGWEFEIRNAIQLKDLNEEPCDRIHKVSRNRIITVSEDGELTVEKRRGG